VPLNQAGHPPRPCALTRDRLQESLNAIRKHVTLTAMFVFGLWIEGRLFPFDLSQPLVALSAFGDIGIGLPYFIAKALSFGAGRVVAITYEYGNAFIIVAGLLNMLTVLDAFDIAQGRK